MMAHRMKSSSSLAPLLSPQVPNATQPSGGLLFKRSVPLRVGSTGLAGAGDVARAVAERGARTLPEVRRHLRGRGRHEHGEQHRARHRNEAERGLQSDLRSLL